MISIRLGRNPNFKENFDNWGEWRNKREKKKIEIIEFCGLCWGQGKLYEYFDDGRDLFPVICPRCITTKGKKKI